MQIMTDSEIPYIWLKFMESEPANINGPSDYISHCCQALLIIAGILFFETFIL